MSHTETAVSTTEDRTLPAVVYGLYLLGLANGLTIFVGLVIAYMNRASAGPRMASHYRYLINTFWVGIVIAIAATALVVVGGVFSIVLIGLPFLALGILIWCVIGVWFAVRCIVGLVYLSRGEGHPRPDTWLA